MESVPVVSQLTSKMSAMASNVKHLKTKITDKVSDSSSDMKDSDWSSMNHPANSGRQAKTGWLRKQGGMVKSWHRRWFVLNGDCLFYFAKEDDLRPLGTIYLPGNKIIQHMANPEEPDKFLMEVVPESIAMNRSKSLSYKSRVPQKLGPSHETFLLCAASDDERQSWIKAIRRVMFASVGGAIFGSRLEEVMEFEKTRSERKVPYLVEACIEFLTEHGTEVEGIFRLPGRTLMVRDLKDRFDEGEHVELDPDIVDVHSVASLLKQYLRELPECLIPYRFYQHFMNLAMNFQGTKNNEKQLEQVKQLQVSMADLPRNNYNLLKKLCVFLHQVSEKTGVNKMSPLNLATVFGPNIIRHPQMEDNPEMFMLTTSDISQQLAYMLINYCADIFTLDYDSGRQSVQVAVDDLLKLDSDMPEGEVLKPAPPKPKPRRSHVEGASGIDELSDIVFDQPADRRARSFQNDVDVNNMSSASREELDLYLSDTIGQEAKPPSVSRMHSEDTSPTNTMPQTSNDGRPIPPLRRKYTRNKHRLNSPSKSVESLSSDQSDLSERSCNDDAGDVNGITSHTVVDNTPNLEVLDLEQKLESLTAEFGNLKLRYDNLNSSKTKSDERVRNLSAEISKVTSYYDDHIKKLEARHKAQVQELCEKLDAERTTRAEAISKVMELQATVHSYQMKYGDLQKELPPLYQ